MSLFADLKEVLTPYAQKIKRLAAIDNEIKADLGDVAESIFSTNESRAISSMLTNEWVGYAMNKAASQTDANAIPNDTYNVYWLIFSRAGSVWFEEIPSANYVAVSVMNGANTPTLDDNDIWRISGTGGNARYRKSEGNLPTPTNKLSFPAGTFLGVTIPATVSASEFYMSFDIDGSDVDKTLFNNDIRLNSTQLGQVADLVSNINYVEYIVGEGSDQSTKHLNIYIAQPSGKYVLYEFVNSVANDKNTNVWRVAYARLVNSNFIVEKDITVIGEWECAMMIVGRSDFAGGYVHGDEVMTKTAVFIDGKKTGLSSIVGKKPFKNLTFVQQSNLYDPNDSSTVFAVHGSAHVFTDVLTVKQSLKFKGEYPMGNSYLAMFPIAKAVSPKAYTDLDFDYSEVALPVDAAGATKIVLSDDTMTAEFKLKSHTPVDARTGDLIVLDNGGLTYNKCYFLACHTGTTVENGDTWLAEVEYKIMA